MQCQADMTYVNCRQAPSAAWSNDFFVTDALMIIGALCARLTHINAEQTHQGKMEAEV